MPIQKETAHKSTALANIKYITNPEKTTDADGRVWVETYNMISSGTAAPRDLHREFREVNQQFEKNNDYDDRKYYHIVINFKSIENVTPEMGMDVGRAYIEHYYPNHQAVMAIHIDENGDIHFHGCVNSVDFITGKKVDRSREELAERKDKVNEIAYEMYGIEPFAWREAVEAKREEEKRQELTGKADNYNATEKAMHQEGRLSELDELRKKILRIALVAQSRQEFEERLQREYGITMPRNTEKTVSFKYKEGKTGTVRGRTLGDYYTAEFIDKMIAYNRSHTTTYFDEQTDAPIMNIDDVDKIAKGRNYILAQSYGMDIPEKDFHRMSEPTLIVRVAIAFVKFQNDNGISYRNGKVYLGNMEVKTDARLQRMADAMSAAQACQEKYGCQTTNDIENKQTELEERLQDMKVELRKERKIETSLKEKLARKEELLSAMEMVFHNRGTPEEMNQARRRLYRNGITKEQFHDPETLARIEEEVERAKSALAEQQAKTKGLFFSQKDMERSIASIENALSGIQLAYDPKFYYGTDVQQHLTIAPEMQPQERSFEDLLHQAAARSRQEETTKRKGQGDGEKKPGYPFTY